MILLPPRSTLLTPSFPPRRASELRKTRPAEVVGGLGTPGNAWTLSGNGIAKTFPIPGAIVDSESNYTVEVEGAPMQSDPNYTPPGGNTGSGGGFHDRSEEHTSELQSLMRISSSVLCLSTKNHDLTRSILI